MNRSVLALAFSAGVAICTAPIAFAAPTAFQSAITAASPALWYQFNETSGNIINHGSLGTTFNATASASVLRAQSTSAGDTGMRFASPNDFLESLSATMLTGNPTFSIEALVNLDASGGALWGPMLHWGGSTTGTAVYFAISNNDNNRIYNGFYNAGVRTTSPIATGKWMHVVWVRQGGTDTASGTTLYINGHVVATQQDPGLNPGFLAAAGINVQSTTFRVNRGADFTSSRTFRGTLDELALYPRALTGAEVVQHARASGVACYTNCDGSTASPSLTAADFVCFLNEFRANAAYANCDGSTGSPALTAADFVCFLNAFRAGCP